MRGGSMKELKQDRERAIHILPLNDITLHSRPLIHRAIAFSCDGELAVAADDSVHILVPDLPNPAAAPPTRLVNGDENEPGNYELRARRSQYTAGQRQMPVSFPPLDQRVNRELFAAAGEAVLINKGRVEGEGQEDEDGFKNGEDQIDDDESGSVTEDVDSVGDVDSGGGGKLFNEENGCSDTPEPERASRGRNHGAGTGPITSVGSSINHLVSMAWSQSGLGLNGRPVLAILTGAGVLAIYGDAGVPVSLSLSAAGSLLPRRDLAPWKVLWGVGERLAVPGQQGKDWFPDNVQGFAWARPLVEMGGRQVLLGYVNDVREVVVLAVQTEERKEGGVGSAGQARKRAKEAHALGGVVWHVREVVRFSIPGPHGKGDVFDPDWVPTGTAFPLSWSPWFEGHGYRICILSYVARNYIGFRKVRLKWPWPIGEAPELEISKTDVYGRCLYLSSNAFVEFENVILCRHQGVLSANLSDPNCHRVVRGIITTGFNIRTFEVAPTETPEMRRLEHRVKDCSTTYDETEPANQNPIVDLMMHPPDLSKLPETPIYSLIRMSATPVNNNKWYETNADTSSIPHWVTSIQQKLDVAFDATDKCARGIAAGGLGSVASSSPSTTNSSSSSNGDTSDVEEGCDEDSDGNDQDTSPAAKYVESRVSTVNLVHPNRFRLWGLAVSPGGGATAVLVSQHSTTMLERAGWQSMRCNIYFASSSRDTSYDAPSNPNIPLTTEGRLFEAMYGGGPPVPGLTTVDPSPIDPALTLISPGFIKAVAHQTCEICATAGLSTPSLSITLPGPIPLTGCPRGHFFSICSASGLAIQGTGGTRMCGACGAKMLRAMVLAKKLLAAASERAGHGSEEVMDLMRGVKCDRCARCGGKFLN